MYPAQWCKNRFTEAQIIGMIGEQGSIACFAADAELLGLRPDVEIE